MEEAPLLLGPAVIDPTDAAFVIGAAIFTALLTEGTFLTMETLVVHSFPLPILETSLILPT